MNLRGMCLVCEKRRDCVLVRFEGDLLVYCRACAHAPNEQYWDEFLAPLLSRMVSEMGQDHLLEPAPFDLGVAPRRKKS